MEYCADWFATASNAKADFRPSVVNTATGVARKEILIHRLIWPSGKIENTRGDGTLCFREHKCCVSSAVLLLTAGIAVVGCGLLAILGGFIGPQGVNATVVILGVVILLVGAGIVYSGIRLMRDPSRTRGVRNARIGNYTANRARKFIS